MSGITRKTTFWNNLRTERNVEFKELGEFMDMSYSTICKWFTGNSVPMDKHIKTLCDFFDVDFETGKAEFIKANNEYVSSRSPENLDEHIEVADQVMLSNDEVSDSKKDVTEILEDEGFAKASEVVCPESTILKMVYGKIPYDTFFKFITLVVDGTGNPLEEIYGQVTFEEYETIRSILIDDEYPDSTEPVEYPDEIPVFDKWGNVIGMKKRDV